MKNKATISPLHAKWHRRVEGQIRDAIHHHPEWFRGDTEVMINSLAKRIVGEIIAAVHVADNTDANGSLIASVNTEAGYDWLRKGARDGGQ